QASVIAIIAIGMTMVIISGGIDLSVGSLMALASVIAAILIREMSGEKTAGTWLLIASSAAAIGVCGAAGAISGTMVTRLGVPAFIVTLSWMMIASGLAYILSDLQTIEVPVSYKVLGHGRWLGVPLPVVVMFGLYAVAHVVMTRSVFGRHLYAVGGNEKAAHLTGIRVAGVRTWAYVICGALAGLGGIIETSVYGRGDPQIGLAYELLVISAVVVGGTSLSGGEGKMLNTLIGSLIIAVIRNAMNLANLESNRQRVVLGLVILGAVLLDRLKRGREDRTR
ncbi:MAG TPA: ABC transporter permease, partial [Pirellulaceae bacterium]|nr:ABC transporter permease [Pirellulaceae bacterium]